MIHPDLYQEITRLSDLLRAKFSPSEFIPGCEVMSVADVSLYASNNGWIEAICGQHNQQRVRWKSAETVIVGDFIDVIYFPDRRIFEAWGLGGAGAIAPPSGGNVWPKADENLLDGVDFASVTALIAAMASDDIGHLGERQSAEAVTINKAISLRGVGATATVFLSTFSITSDMRTLQDVGVDTSGVNAQGFNVNINGTTTLRDCNGACFGSTTSRALDVSTPGAGAEVWVIGGRYEGIGTLPFDVYADTDAIIYLDGPTLVNGTIGGPGDVFGWYLDTLGNVHLAPKTGITSGVWLEDISTGLSVYYSTFALANAAAAAGDTIIIRQSGSYACAGETLAAGVNLCILPDVLLTGTSQYTLSLAGSNYVFGGGTVEKTGSTAVQAAAVRFTGNNSIVDDIDGICSNSHASGFGYGFYQTGQTGIELRNCRGDATGTTGDNYGFRKDTSAGGTCKITGGYYAGDTGSVYNDQTGAVTLVDPVLVGDVSGAAVAGNYGTGAGYQLSLSQPLFSAYNSATDTNVTGDGTVYQVIFNTEIFDRDSNWNNSTGTFTAPVTGKYLFVTTIFSLEIGVSHTTMLLRIATSNNTYDAAYFNPINAASGTIGITASIIADMDAGDTATFNVAVSGGAKTVDVYGVGAPTTFVMGYLLP